MSENESDHDVPTLRRVEPTTNKFKDGIRRTILVLAAVWLLLEAIRP